MNQRRHGFRLSLRLAAAVFPLALATGALAQGGVIFANRVTSPVVIIAPVYGPEPGNPALRLRGHAITNGGGIDYHGPLLKGAGFTAALYAGPEGTTDESQLSLLATATFRTTDTLAGFIVSPVAAVPLPFSPGSILTFQLRAWDNQNGAVNSWEEALDALSPRGSSALFTPPTPVGVDPIYLVGLQSFCIASPLPVLAQITQPPQNTTASAGSPASLGVGYIGAQPMSVRWRLNGTNLPGDTSALLARPSVLHTDAGFYTVVLSNRYNSVTSPPALLVVPPKLLPPERLAPGTIRLAFDAAPGQAVALEMRPSLPGANWVTLASATNATVRAQFLDTQATNAPRFYRLRHTP